MGRAAGPRGHAGSADGAAAALPDQRGGGMAGPGAVRAGGVSVYKRPNGKWAAQVYDPVTRRPRQVGTYGTRREAIKAESAALDQRTATGRETVSSFAARWMVDYPRPRASTNMHNAE